MADLCAADHWYDVASSPGYRREQRQRSGQQWRRSEEASQNIEAKTCSGDRKSIKGGIGNGIIKNKGSV